MDTSQEGKAEDKDGEGTTGDPIGRVSRGAVEVPGFQGEALEDRRLRPSLMVSPAIPGLGGGVSKIETGLQSETLSQKLNNVRR